MLKVVQLRIYTLLREMCLALLYGDYDPEAFFENDLGLVILDEEVKGITEFPTVGLLDILAKTMLRKLVP